MHINWYLPWYDHDEVYGEVCIAVNASSMALASKTLNPNVNVRYSHSTLLQYITHHSLKVWKNKRDVKYMMGSMKETASEARVPLSTVASQVVNPNVIAMFMALNIATISYTSHIDA